MTRRKLRAQAANLRRALIARRFGMRNARTIADEARRAGLTYDLAFAMVEQESGNGCNVFGHDPTIFVGAGRVSKARYQAYKAARGRTHMQGVGPLQLTWWELQDEADRIGGCWIPRNNLHVGFRHLKELIDTHGERDGIRRYNGSGPAAEAYARSVLARKAKWHARFN